MPLVARMTDAIVGTGQGGAITGTITANCSSDVYVNGLQVATVGSITTEACQLHAGAGVIAVGSATVFVNGKPVARLGDEVTSHCGVSFITTGSATVNVGG